jgi:hypothetical protein
MERRRGEGPSTADVLPVLLSLGEGVVFVFVDDGTIGRDDSSQTCTERSGDERGAVKEGDRLEQRPGAPRGCGH